MKIDENHCLLTQTIKKKLVRTLIMTMYRSVYDAKYKHRSAESMRLYHDSV